MTRITVDPVQLSAYGKKLSDLSSRMSSTLDTLQEKVDNLQGWYGPDAESFKKNAEEYIKENRRIEISLNGYSSTVNNKASYYSKRISDFYSRLG